MSEMVTISKACDHCGTRATTRVSRKSLEARYEGALMQDAFPELSLEVRELFFGIGLCSACWDAMLGEGEDE